MARTILKTAAAAVFVISAATAPAVADDTSVCVKAVGDDAIAACSRLIDRRAGDLSLAYYSRGRARHYRGDNDLAIADLGEAIRRKPSFAFAYMTRGTAYLAKQDYDVAIADYSEAIRVNPDYSEAYQSRGSAYLAKKDYDRAIADLGESIRRKPDYVVAYIVRGSTYYAKKDFDRAIADFNEAIRRQPDNSASYQSRGSAYFAKNDYDRAIADYSAAVKRKPDYADGYLSRGYAYYFKNDYDLAIADYTEAIRIKQDNATAIYSRGTAYSMKKDFDRAIADFTEAIRITPKSMVIYRERGAAFHLKGQFDRAIADYAEAIRLDPTDAASFRGRGVSHRELGNLDSAFSDLNESIRLNPNHALAYSSRGLAFEKRGDSVRARQDFESALARPGPDPLTKFGLEIATTRLAALSSTPTVAAATPSTAAAIATATPSISNDRRIALVIGNSAYKNAPSLPNPQRDAALVADALKRSGFSAVTLQTDLTRDAVVNALRAFAQAAESADWAVIYYAGHGMEVGGVNYLLPVDARIAADRDIGFEAVALDQVLNAAERAKKLRLVILDACRDNPFANQMKRTMTVATRSVSRGLAAVEPEAGTLVVYAAKDGETALDGDGANSPFATAFVKNLQTPNLEVRRLFDFVRDDVMETTKRKQKPFSYGSISGRHDFYFVASK